MNRVEAQRLIVPELSTGSVADLCEMAMVAQPDGYKSRAAPQILTADFTTLFHTQEVEPWCGSTN